MNVDDFFTIGSAHHAEGTPCEDYALSGSLASGVAFGVVADGCSSAKSNTDIGARAISWAFKQALEQRSSPPGEWFGPGFSDLLKERFVRNQFGGAPEAYLATVVGFAATTEAASVFVHGDGAVGLRYADGKVRLIQFTWWDNGPFYLNYQVHTNWLDEFVALYADGVVEPFGRRDTILEVRDGEYIVTRTEHVRFSLDDVFHGHVMHFRPAEEGIVAIAVLSDGIEQFKLPSTAQVPAGMAAFLEAGKVAAEVVAYKNFEGVFVKRRMLRALQDYRKSGVIPRDDVAAAAVWIGENK